MNQLHCLALWLLTGLCASQVIKDDACKPGFHSELSQTSRSTGYDTRTTDSPVCDNKLRRGWYTFTGLGGVAVEMPTSCPGTDTCGTTIPLWINGTYPTVADGIVSLSLCGKTDKTSSDCCEYQDQVFVSNCSNFYIYYLNPTLDCPSAYCAGSAKRCAVGKWSNSGFEPCRDPAPVLQTLPVATGPIVEADQSFHFQCEFVYGPLDADQVFEVSWTFNGKADPSVTPQILAADQRVATLTGDKLATHLDTNVGCQVKTHYVGHERDQNTYSSNTNYFGVQAIAVTGPHVHGSKSFDFECNVTTGSSDPDQQIEVVWTFNGVQDAGVPPQVISGQNRKATLDGTALKGHFNTNVGCQARLVFQKPNITTVFKASNTYFVGIQVNPATVAIADSEGEKTVTVTSTIPVVCDQGPNCCLEWTMTVDQKTVVSIKDSCNHKICASDWDDQANQASFNLTLVPSRNALGGVTRRAVLTFGETTISGTGPYLDLFTGYKPNPLPIAVTLEPGFSCSATGDPHFQGFDHRDSYHLYQTGDFTVYTVPNRNFVVQIRTYQCTPYVTCICGVVVREQNDIIRLHGCNNPHNLATSTIDIPYTLSPGTVVSRSSDSYHVGILLASGSEIKIDIAAWYMNLYIQTPAYDRNQAVGICGTNDGIPGNDFTHPDGTVSPLCANCVPAAFTESWRVTGSASFFEVAPLQIQEEPPAQFCSCSLNAQGKLEFTCSPRQHIQDTNLACNQCPEVTATLKPAAWGQGNNTTPAYVHKPVAAVDPNKQWPNVKGITEAQARAMCLASVQKSQLYTRCQPVGNLVANAMDDCLGDILYGGLTAPLDAITTSFTTNCQLVLVRDIKNYVPAPGGGLTLDPTINDLVCQIECAQHGTCAANGTCQCQTGWEGETCLIDIVKGPVIKSVTGGFLCYESDPTCRSFDFFKSNVDIRDHIKCRLQHVTPTGVKTGPAVVVDAINESATKFTCPVPKPEKSMERYVVSVTTDGVKYGNELPLHVYDTSCMDCVGRSCKIKTMTCLIKDVCYQDGETNKTNPQQKCDAKSTQTNWS